MYSRFIPQDTVFHPLPPEEEPSAPPPRRGPAQQAPQPAGPHPANRTGMTGGGKPLGGLLDGVAQELKKLGLFERFSLEDLDSGDILLILIVLFLFVEGDNIDLAIALGLMLLLSLGEKESESPTPPPDEEPFRQEE